MKPHRKRFKKEIVSLIHSQGFGGKFPHFRKVTDSHLHLVDFQFDRWGEDSFVLELAVLPRGDLQTSWGESIPEDKLDGAYTNPDDRLRLGSIDGQDHWFEFTDSDNCELLDRIEKLFQTQAKAYFESRTSQKT